MKTLSLVKTAGIIILVFFLSLMPAQAGDASSFRFAAGGKIIQGKAITKDNRTWVDLESFRSCIAVFGNESSFDGKSRLLALDCRELPKNLPPEGDTPLTLAAGGKLSKIPAMDKDGMVFIPLDLIKPLLQALNLSFELDEASSMMAVNRGKNADTAAISEKPFISPQEEIEQVKKQTEAGAEGVRKYLDVLKEIFDRRKPSSKDMAKFQEALLNIGSGKLNTDDLLSLAEKYRGAAEEIKKLRPPDRETQELNRMAIGIFNKMKDLVDTAVMLLNLEKGIENPDALLKLRRLNMEIGEESARFDKMVFELKKKYNLKNP